MKIHDLDSLGQRYSKNPNSPSTYFIESSWVAEMCLSFFEFAAAIKLIHIPNLRYVPRTEALI